MNKRASVRMTAKCHTHHRPHPSQATPTWVKGLTPSNQAHVTRPLSYVPVRSEGAPANPPHTPADATGFTDALLG